MPDLSLSVWGVAKWFVVFGFGIYLVFAFVVVRQVKLMTDTLEVDFEKPVIFLAYIHLLFAICVLLLSVIVL